jgi:hypothetical protein
MSEHASKTNKKRLARSARQKSRVEEIVDFLEDVALNRKTATEEEVGTAMRKLSEYLSHLQGE